MWPFFKVSWPLSWRTPQRKLMPDEVWILCPHLSYTYQALRYARLCSKHFPEQNHWALTVSLWCKGCHGPILQIGKKGQLVAQDGTVKRGAKQDGTLPPGRLAPEPLLFDTMLSCMLMWQWGSRWTVCSPAEVPLSAWDQPAGRAEPTGPGASPLSAHATRLCSTVPHPPHSPRLPVPAVVLSDGTVLGGIRGCLLA